MESHCHGIFPISFLNIQPKDIPIEELEHSKNATRIKENIVKMIQKSYKHRTVPGLMQSLHILTVNNLGRILSSSLNVYRLYNSFLLKKKTPGNLSFLT